MEGGPLALRPDKPLPPDPPSTATSLPMSDMQTPSEKSRSSSRQSVGSSSFAPSEEEKSDTKAPAQLHESSRIREAYSNPSTNTLHTDTFPSPETEKVEYLNEKDFRNIDRYGFLRVQASNCDPPEVRNRDAVPKDDRNGRKSRRSSSVPARRKKLLTKSKDDILLQPRKIDEAKMTAKEFERTKKWRDMAVIARPNGIIGYQFPITKKLVQRTFKGIPDCWRATVWHEILTSQAGLRDDSESERDLIQAYFEMCEQDCDDDAQIDLDVPRTISEHIFFRQRYGAGQRLLFQVLHCISLKFPRHGYVQGMAPIAATLLCYYPAEIAFVMLVRLWQDKGLKNFFSPDFDGLMIAFKSLEDTLKSRPVGWKLTSLGIDPTSYATRWYLTLFNYSLPFHTQLRIWDALMISDDGPAMLHATALALLHGLSSRLKNVDFERGMKLVTGRIDVQDDDKLMRLVFEEALANGALKFQF